MRSNKTPVRKSQKLLNLVLLVLGILALSAAFVSQWSGEKPARDMLQNPPFAEQTRSDGFKTLDAKVVRVADGDTVYVKGSDGSEQRVRLLGIDAPESKQAWGKESEQNLKRNLRSSDYRVQVVYKGHDQYGRIVGKLVANGKDLNLAQVASGNAWVYKNFLRDLEPGDADRYLKAEARARAEKLGLWQQDNPQNPREWRKEHPRS